MPWRASLKFRYSKICSEAPAATQIIRCLDCPVYSVHLAVQSISEMPEDPLPQSPPAAIKLRPVDLRPTPLTGWRRLIPIQIKKTSDGKTVLIAWKQALASILVVALIGWAAVAAAAYWFIKYQREFPGVKFSQMLFYPVERENYRRERGNHLVDQAKSEFKLGKFKDAFHKLRVAAVLAPENRDGRTMLSHFYVLWKRPDLAHKHLVEGVRIGEPDRAYLDAVFKFLLLRQADFDVMRITEKLLREAGDQPTPDERITLIAKARATAQFFRGNYDAAEDTLIKYGVAGTPDGRMLQTRIDWERGDQDGALDRLEKLCEEQPNNEQLYSQLTSYLREAGKDDKLRRQTVLRLLAHVNNASARIDLLFIHSKNGETTEVEQTVSSLFRDFGSDSDVLIAMGDFAANTGDPALARRIYLHCKEKKLPWEGPALLTVEAHLVARQYRAALDACAELQAANPEWARRFRAAFNGLQSVAHFGLADLEAADLFLANFLNQSDIRSDNLIAVANRLAAVGASEGARRVLKQAVQTDPLNQAALSGLIRLNLDTEHTDETPQLLEILLAMRKPSVTLLRETNQRLASDRFLFVPGRTTALDRLQAIL